MVSVTLTGFKELEERIASIGERTPQNIATALYEEANIIMADSKTNYVPFDTGNLANSGRVDPPVVAGNDISVTFGYGGSAAAYAIEIHENPRAGKTEGWNPDHTQRYQHWARRGEWKYLETPLKNRAPELGKQLADAIADFFGKKVLRLADAYDRMARGDNGPT